MVQYWLRISLVTYALLLFLVMYRELIKGSDMEGTIFFAALTSFIGSCIVLFVYVILNAFVGGEV